MKYLKILVVVAFFTFVCSSFVSADGTPRKYKFISIELPSHQIETIYDVIVEKTEDSKQYYENYSTSQVNVRVRTVTIGGTLGATSGTYSNLIKVNKGVVKTWGQAPENAFSGQYKIALRNADNILIKTVGGTWCLDESIYNALYNNN